MPRHAHTSHVCAALVLSAEAHVLATEAQRHPYPAMRHETAHMLLHLRTISLRCSLRQPVQQIRHRDVIQIGADAIVELSPKRARGTVLGMQAGGTIVFQTAHRRDGSLGKPQNLAHRVLLGALATTGILRPCRACLKANCHAPKQQGCFSRYFSEIPWRSATSFRGTRPSP